MPLLERDAQLASLGEFAGEARHGEGRLVLIAGEAGVRRLAVIPQLASPENCHWLSQAQASVAADQSTTACYGSAQNQTLGAPTAVPNLARKSVIRNRPDLSSGYHQ